MTAIGSRSAGTVRRCGCSPAAAMTGLKMNVINTAQLEKRLVAPDQLLCLFPPLINDASRRSVAGRSAANQNGIEAAIRFS
jgi:hypothetical protein